jgi:hypothetical protein
MNNNLFFVLISCVSICFTIIVICNGPIINGLVKFSPDDNCKKLSDEYNNAKKTSNLNDEQKKGYKRIINKCNRKKAMYGLEYSSLILDIFFSFVCCLLGFLNYYGVAKGFEKITGIIGLASGVICFIMTLVYICYSGYIFTNDSSGTVKLDKDGSYAEWKDGKYKCTFYDEDDEDAIYAKYSDLGKKQYNYNKDNYFLSPDSQLLKCKIMYNSEEASPCESSTTGEIDLTPYGITRPQYDGKNCDKLYYNQKNDSIENKYNYDRWVTSIIFGVFIIACSIGLALFGFLIFKDSGSSGHTPV